MNHNTATPDLDKVLDWMDSADIYKKRHAFPSRYYILPRTGWPLIDDLMVPIYHVGGNVYLKIEGRSLKDTPIEGFDDISEQMESDIDICCHDNWKPGDDINSWLAVRCMKQDKYLTAISLKSIDYLKTKLGIDVLKRILL